ncbi:hypothetical protein GQ457_05G035440 [Hibiscus cannabinus]
MGFRSPFIFGLFCCFLIIGGRYGKLKWGGKGSDGVGEGGTGWGTRGGGRVRWKDLIGGNVEIPSPALIFGNIGFHLERSFSDDVPKLPFFLPKFVSGFWWSTSTLKSQKTSPLFSYGDKNKL